jgi:hypothetical protein
MPDLQDSIRMERRILHLIIENAVARARLAEGLRGYAWRDLAHRVIFQIVLGAPQASAERLRLILPAHLTNAGFPDFPCEELFLGTPCTVQEAESILRESPPPAAR